MAEVAKAIGRPPTYPTKYFGCELGAQTLFDFKVSVEQLKLEPTNYVPFFYHKRMSVLS